MPKQDFLVLTDSACDMPPELERSSGVEIMNFSITVDGTAYSEREDFSFEEYYGMLRSCENVPSTAHVTQTRFLEKFLASDDAGIRQLLYVSINADGSATNNAAQMAREAFEKERPASPMKIWIVDSHTYSMGYGWYVAQAAGRLAGGAAMADVVRWLEEDIFRRLEISLGAYSLRFMKKSGRISAAAAFAGELLGLRPVISLNQGVSEVRNKVRGDAALAPALLAWADGRIGDEREYGVGGTDKEAITRLAALCEEKWGRPPITTFYLGAAVATNTGPDAIAIIYLAN